jgi:outer membrane receptor for ferrienterochelin and colicins
MDWIGRQRIPDTSSNPYGYRLSEYASDYVLMNAQISKDFKNRWSVYLGVENISNYRLRNPIVAAGEPFSPYFDSSLVWGADLRKNDVRGFRFRIP